MGGAGGAPACNYLREFSKLLLHTIFLLGKIMPITPYALPQAVGQAVPVTVSMQYVDASGLQQLAVYGIVIEYDSPGLYNVWVNNVLVNGPLNALQITTLLEYLEQKRPHAQPIGNLVCQSAKTHTLPKRQTWIWSEI